MFKQKFINAPKSGVIYIPQIYLKSLSHIISPSLPFYKEILCMGAVLPDVVRERV